MAFTDAIELEPRYRDDSVDPAATMVRVAEIIAAHDAAYWEPRFLKADCCCTVVKTVREAMDDEQFKQRGLFSQKLVNAKGDSIPATPVPIVKSFRAHGEEGVGASALGAHNDEYLK
jgi:crotonobetainyl-CoA:carnitine CoA-transferase CaiB-like acyl-CoA transferase